MSTKGGVRRAQPARRGRAWCALLIGIPAAALGPATLPAQTQDTVYVTRIPASVRSVGLNGAGVALMGDAAAVFQNPTGLATLRYIGLEGSYRGAPGGAYAFTGALGWRIKQFDIGVGGQRFDFGDNPHDYLGGGIPAGTNAREILGVASVVYRFGMIALGVSGKYASRRIDDVWTYGVSGDAGVAIAFFDIMAIAVSMQNINGNWRDTSSLVMPRVTRFGFTMNYVDPQESFRLLSTLEVQWREGEKSRGVIGGEAGVVLGGVGIIARAGFSGRPDVLSDSEFTVGGSVQFRALLLDYAYRDKDLFDEPSHYFGFRFTL